MRGLSFFRYEPRELARLRRAQVFGLVIPLGVWAAVSGLTWLLLYGATLAVTLALWRRYRPAR